MTLQAGAIEGEVIAALDALLGRYGGTGTQTRHDQQSHRFLEEELAQQRVELEVGDPATAGQPLFHLEPSPAPALDARARRQAEEQWQAARARWRSAQARLEQQQAARRFGEAEYERLADGLRVRLDD